MSLSEELQKQADNYLDNSMSEQEKTAFELELSSNKELQDYLAINKEMRVQFDDSNWQFVEPSDSKQVKELKDYFKSNDANDLKSVLKKTASSYHQSNQSSKSKSIKLYSFLAVAASIVLLLGLFVFNNDQNLYDNYNSWDELPSLIERGVGQSNILQEAEASFLDKKYSKANQLYGKYIDNAKEINPTVYLYLGITELELSQSEKALKTFDKIAIKLL